MAKGRKTGGRQAGTPNRLTMDLRSAIIEAARDADPSDSKTIEGYLSWAAVQVPQAFLSLLAKTLPTQVAASVTTTCATKAQRDAAVAAALRADT